MSKLRRGLLAASLTAAVVSALGVASTMRAEADQIPAAAGLTPPALLPWGEKPTKIRTGPAGASSDDLRRAGLIAAPADAGGSIQPRGRYARKGRPGLNATAVAAAATKYFYNVGSQPAETDGFSGNVTIAKPKLGATDHHTLAELSVQSADGRQIVEIGWTVDRLLNGDDDPHLFVYHWVNGAETCYNGCGFVQVSTSVKPGDTLAYGTAAKFGIQFSGGGWWVTFGTEWIGYFAETLWTDRGVVSFKRSGLIQVFGEVAAPSAKPCTQMGNGLAGTNASAAVLGSVTYTNGPTVALNIRSTTGIYTVNALSGRTFQYGGPGAC